MAPEQVSAEGLETRINGLAYVALLGALLIVIMPPCIGFGWMDWRYEKQQREIESLRAELAKQKEELAKVRHLAEMELRRIHHNPPLEPKKTSEQPFGKEP